MAITVGTAYSSGNDGNSTGVTFSATTAANTKALVVVVTIYDSSATDSVVNSVTFNTTTSLAQIPVGRYRNGSATVSIWWVANPPITTANVVVASAGTCTDLQATAVGLIDVGASSIVYDSFDTGTGSGSASGAVNPARTGSVAIGGGIAQGADPAALSVTTGAELSGSEVDMGSQTASCGSAAESGGSATITWTYSAVTCDTQVASFVAGPPTALFFNGTTQYGTLTNWAGIDAMTDGTLTLEAWVKNNSTSAAYTAFIVGGDGTDTAYYFLTENATGSEGINAKYDYGAGTDASVVQDTGILTKETWIHIAMVCQASAKTKIYKNGTEISYDTQTTPSGTPYNLDAVSFYFGYNAKASPTYYKNTLGGFVRLWSTVRTQTEITNNKALHLQGAKETGLLINLKFAEGSGATLDNEATAGQDMSLTNSPTWVAGPEGITEKEYPSERRVFITHQ